MHISLTENGEGFFAYSSLITDVNTIANYVYSFAHTNT